MNNLLTLVFGKSNPMHTAFDVWLAWQTGDKGFGQLHNKP